MAQPLSISSNNRLLYAGVLLINVCFYIILVSVSRPENDYQNFYIAGQTSRAAPSMIYDWKYQNQAQKQAFPDSGFFPFLHPPQELVLFAPFSLLPYRVSLEAWRLFSLFCLLLSTQLLAQGIHLDRSATFLIMAALSPVFLCIALGQDALLLLLITCYAFRLLQRRADITAGFVMSLSLFKPQLAIFIAIALVAIGRYRYVLAFLISSSAMVGLSVLYIGRAGVEKLRECTRLTENQLPSIRMPTIRGVIGLVSHDHFYITFSITMLIVFVFFWQWRQHPHLEFAFATAICVASVASLHLFVYDLVLLAIPIALLARAPRPSDVRYLVLITSAPLLLLLSFLKLPALLIIPTVLIGIACFRLRNSNFATQPQPIHIDGSNVPAGAPPLS